jgi:hypothetical protein
MEKAIYFPEKEAYAFPESVKERDHGQSATKNRGGILACLTAACGLAGDGVWANPAGGNWEDDVNWLGEAIAVFNRVLAAGELQAIAFENRQAAAGDGVFVNPAGGAWETAANWQDGTIANGAGATATFRALPPGGSARNIGTLVFGTP